MLEGVKYALEGTCSRIKQQTVKQHQMDDINIMEKIVPCSFVAATNQEAKRCLGVCVGTHTLGGGGTCRN